MVTAYCLMFLSTFTWCFFLQGRTTKARPLRFNVGEPFGNAFTGWNPEPVNAEILQQAGPVFDDAIHLKLKLFQRSVYDGAPLKAGWLQEDAAQLYGRDLHQQAASQLEPSWKRPLEAHNREKSTGADGGLFFSMLKVPRQVLPGQHWTTVLKCQNFYKQQSVLAMYWLSFSAVGRMESLQGNTSSSEPPEKESLRTPFQRF